MPVYRINLRLTAESLEQARAVIAALRPILGAALNLQTPQRGRRPNGQADPPWFIYGSYTFEPFTTPEEQIHKDAVAEVTAHRQDLTRKIAAEINTVRREAAKKRKRKT